MPVSAVRCCGFQYSVDDVAILSFGLCPGGRPPTPFARERYLQNTYVTNSVRSVVCSGGVSALRPRLIKKSRFRRRFWPVILLNPRSFEESHDTVTIRYGFILATGRSLLRLPAGPPLRSDLGQRRLPLSEVTLFPRDSY